MLQLPLQIYFDVIKRSVLGVLTIFRTVNFSSVLLVVASRACDVLLTASAASFRHYPWLRHQVSQVLIYCTGSRSSGCNLARSVSITLLIFDSSYLCY